MRNYERETPSIRGAYETHGVDRFYRQFGEDYRNPHEPVVRRSLKLAVERWTPALDCVLDLAAGSGEATLALREMGASVAGMDPFTADAYELRTGQAAERFSFADVAAGVLAGRRYSLIVCSFAMHLCERSRLPGVVRQLACVSDSMLIVTPHKRPAIRTEWGWELLDELVVERVRARMYRVKQ